MKKTDINIDILDANFHDEYESFVESNEDSLIYYSIRYKYFLESILKNSENIYFLAKLKNKIVGVFPTSVMTSVDGRKIVNSLPFYGSHGGILILDKYQDEEVIRTELIKIYSRYCEDLDVVSSTIVSNPLFIDDSFYAKTLKYTHLDKRVGQVTMLPENIKDEGLIDDKLMKMMHSKTRNMVRKGLKGNFNIFHSNEPEYVEYLYNTHRQNLEEIGGMVKSPEVFLELFKQFEYGKYLRLYVAQDKITGENSAALLLLYFNGRVEYYTPVISNKYRKEQVLSAIIFNAMKEACLLGYKYWNWGGTWLTQDGVYHFKKRWGSVDKPYYYYTRIYDNSIMELRKHEALELFPFYYVFPFN